MKVGLVLSGGGAKGAYQVGILQSLADHGIEVSMVSGASIGSLNGAIVASSSDSATAAARLRDVWELAASEGVLEFEGRNVPRYLAMLAAAGLTGPGRVGLAMLAGWYGRGEERELGLLKTTPLSRILDRYLASAELSSGKPMYVSLYPYQGRLSAISEFIKGDVLKRFDTRQSVFRHIQSLSEENQREALLASAAIPVLFTPRKVEGHLYSDGGQGDYKSAQGNTPITPLLNRGLDAIIVSHLSDGVLWDSADFPNETILEIRPDSLIAEDGLPDMLGFKEEKIEKWMNQGKVDTDALLNKLMRYSGARTRMSSETTNLQSKVGHDRDNLRSSSLEEVMSKLRNSD